MAELLHHVMRGAPDGPVLLLIHPLGADLRFWEECIPIWDGSIPSLACDLRSAGSSPRSREPVTIARHVADLETLRQALGLGAVVPVGCAIGAMVGAAYAARHPERASALLLSNPARRTSERAAAMLRERAELVRRGGMSAILPGAVERAFVGQPRDQRFQRYLARFAAQDAEAYALSTLALLDADVSADLDAIRCPTLVVAGGNDMLLPSEQAQEIHALLAQADLVLLEDAAHFIPFQTPARFARLVLDFLGRNRPAHP